MHYNVNAVSGYQALALIAAFLLRLFVCVGIIHNVGDVRIYTLYEPTYRKRLDLPGFVKEYRWHLIQKPHFPSDQGSIADLGSSIACFVPIQTRREQLSCRCPQGLRGNNIAIIC